MRKILPLQHLESRVPNHLNTKPTQISCDRRSRLISLKTRRTLEDIENNLMEKKYKSQKVMNSF